MRRCLLYLMVVAASVLWPCATALAANLTLASGVSNYGKGYASAQYHRNGDMVVLSGMVRRAHKGPALIATLPRSQAPSKRLVFHVSRHDRSARVDVMPDGKVIWVAGGTAGWVSLDGIAFSKGRATRLSLTSSWAAVGGPFQAPRSFKSGTLVQLSGLAKNKRPGVTHIGTLPKERRPARRLIFHLNAHASHARVDVMPNGRIELVGALPLHKWVSLDNIRFDVGQRHFAFREGGWMPLSGPYAPVGFKLAGRMVSLTGAIKPGARSRAGTVLTLPVGARPSATRIFYQGTHRSGARVDVMKDGRVVVHGRKPGWLSLEGMRFAAVGKLAPPITLPKLSTSFATPTAGAAPMSRATRVGSIHVPKPHGRAFLDPRNGGEWWRCPDSRPRRTAHAVTDRRACATRAIFGEKLAPAIFLGKRVRPKPARGFVDPRNGGEWWTCPKNTTRTIHAVTSASACQGRCPSGAITTPGGCVRCPAGSKFTGINGDPARSCLKLAQGAAWFKARGKKYERELKQRVENLPAEFTKEMKAIAAKFKEVSDKHAAEAARAHTKAARKALAHKVSAIMRPWLKKRRKGAGAQAKTSANPFGYPPARCGENMAECTITVGFAFDVSILAGVSVSQLWAWDTTWERQGSDRTQFYTDVGYTGGVALGGGNGLQLGRWSDPSHKLDGVSHGIDASVSKVVGLGLAYYFNKNGLIGWTLSGMLGGADAQVKYVYSQTSKPTPY